MNLGLEETEVISDEENVPTEEEEETRINSKSIIANSSTNYSLQPQSIQPGFNSTIDNYDDSLTWHKIAVYSNSGFSDSKQILQKIQGSLGHPVQIFSWSVLSPRVFNFYVKGQSIANEIAKVTSIPDVTFKPNSNSQNPPTARITSELKEKLTETLIARFKKTTGHLNLSNFAESNDLIFDYWLPLTKPMVRVAVNEILSLNDTFSKITSIDLSRNKLVSLEGFDCLTSDKIRVLHLNDNYITTIKVLEPLKTLPLRELAIQNNPVETITEIITDDGQVEPYFYLEEIKKIFPDLAVLNSKPLGAPKRPLDSSTDNDPSSHTPPSKLSRQDSDEKEGKFNRSNHHEEAKLRNNKHNNVDTNPTSLTTSHVISLQRQLTESGVEVKNLSVLVQDLCRRQRKTENHLKRMVQDNQFYKSEMDRMSWQIHQQQQQLHQQQQQLNEQQQQLYQHHQQLQKQRMQPPQPRPSTAATLPPRRPSITTTSYDQYQPPVRVTKRSPPSSSSSTLGAGGSGTLEDFDDLFVRPSRS